ncbi:MAG: right-handed parallel beta-helix repeat-containing protein [Geobacteraceae bacterium]|nr:right-handed parallel beta-helix repeat-containing protein [Geobacteraceae bacterium]
MTFRSFCVCLLTALWMLPALAPYAAAASQGRTTITATYVNATFSEDTTWRGTIIVKGYVVVAPQTTLRIEPGTVIRFMPAKDSLQLPRLLVMGRIQSVGTADRPILFTTGNAQSDRGDWGGLLLLSSEKSNQLEYCRIEGAETGLEARFSTFTAKALSITRSTTGCILRDSTVTLTSPNINACDTGIEAHDSEIELHAATFAANRRGMVLSRSSVVMTTVAVTGSTQQAMVTNDCRLKINSCEISDNAAGAHIIGGEGQVFLSRFVRNRQTALHLDSARLKISRCQIADNLRDGLMLEDDRATIWDNVISNNGGYNLVYNGRDTVSATLNWWGGSAEATITAKLSANSSPQRSAAVKVFPWLFEKPAIFP